MDFMSILETIKEYVPVPVIVAVIAVIMLVYGSLFLTKSIENYLEEKKGKQIKIFDHKKIWLSALWCAVTVVTLALAKHIEWRECPFYFFVILSASSFLYEAFLKKIGLKKEDA